MERKRGGERKRGDEGKGREERDGREGEGTLRHNFGDGRPCVIKGCQIQIH